MICIWPDRIINRILANWWTNKKINIIKPCCNGQGDWNEREKRRGEGVTCSYLAHLIVKNLIKTDLTVCASLLVAQQQQQAQKHQSLVGVVVLVVCLSVDDDDDLNSRCISWIMIAIPGHANEMRILNDSVRILLQELLLFFYRRPSIVFSRGGVWQPRKPQCNGNESKDFKNSVSSSEKRERRIGFVYIR